jgi:hypothetical protein
VGTASEGVLFPGDRVVSINHQDTSRMTHLEAQVRVARWYISKLIIQLWANFGRVLYMVYFMSIRSILRLVGKFYVPLVYFVIVWYIFSRCGMLKVLFPLIGHPAQWQKMWFDILKFDNMSFRLFEISTICQFDNMVFYNRAFYNFAFYNLVFYIVSPFLLFLITPFSSTNFLTRDMAVMYLLRIFNAKHLSY